MRIRFALLLLAGCAAPAEVGDSERADRLRREGKAPAAYAAYARALCSSPADLELALRLVQAWDGLGQPGRPGMVVEDCPLDAAVSAFLEGLEAGARGDIEAAERAFAQAGRAAPEVNRPEISYRRGLVNLQAGRHAAALEQLQRAAGLAPDRSDIRLALAQTRLAMGEYRNVVDELRGMLRIEPDPQDVARGRHVLSAAVKRSEQPLPEGVADSIAQSLGALDRGELSRERTLELLALAATVRHPRVMMVAGLAALQQGITGEAERLLADAAQLNPLDPDPVRALGISLFAAERLNEAFPPLREAFLRDPLDVEVARRLAQAAGDVGDMDTARESYRALVALEPRRAEHHLWLARIERQMGNLAGARRAAEAGYALDKASIPILLERAVVLAKIARSAPTDSERSEAADLTRETVDELLEVSPQHPGADAIIQSLEE